MPLPEKHAVCGDRLALAEAAAPALAAGADYVAPVPRQGVDPGLPLVVPAATVHAALASQPDPLLAPVGEVRRLPALVEGWVPPGLDEAVLRVRQGLFLLGP